MDIQTYECIDKQRDKNNNIIGYLLRDVNTGRKIPVRKDELKPMIQSGVVELTNMQIDSQGRLVEKPANKQNKPQKNNDISNMELKKYIYDIVGKLLGEWKDAKNVISHTRQIAYDTNRKVNGLLENSNNAGAVADINDMQAYLMRHDAEFEEIKTGINNITNQLSSFQAPVQAERVDSGNSVVSKLEHPDDPYEKYYHDIYFAENNYDENGDIPALLSAYDSRLSGINITPEIIKLLRSEMDKTSEAYYYTEKFYNAQFADYASKVGSSQLLECSISTVAGSFEKAAGASANVYKRVGEETLNYMLDLIPGCQQVARNRRIKADFGKKGLSVDKIHKMRTEVAAIWNCGIEFICNQPEWEVMLYVIQTMNHMNLETYSIKNCNVYGGVNQVTYADVDKINTKGNKLVEDSLGDIAKWYEKRSICQDMQLKVCKQVYDRFIISYYAGKKLLYAKRLYPFTDCATSEINGVLVRLIEIGMYLSNVAPQVAKAQIENFKQYNNNKGSGHRVSENVDIMKYLG